MRTTQKRHFSGKGVSLPRCHRLPTEQRCSFVTRLPAEEDFTAHQRTFPRLPAGDEEMEHIRHHRNQRRARANELILYMLVQNAQRFAERE